MIFAELFGEHYQNGVCTRTSISVKYAQMMLTSGLDLYAVPMVMPIHLMDVVAHWRMHSIQVSTIEVSVPCYRENSMSHVWWDTV